MRILTLIIAIAMLASGINPVMADDKSDNAVSDSWHDYLPEMPCNIFAQTDDDGEHPEFAQGKPGKRRQQRKHVEQLRMLKMLELLELEQDQEISFLTAYNRMRSDISRADNSRTELLIELGDKLNNEASIDSEIKSLLEQIDSNRQEKQNVVDGFIKQASTILTVRQLGKLVMFNEHFERELLDRVRAFREGEMGRMRQDGL